MIEWLWALLITEAVEVPVYSTALKARTAGRRLVLAFVPSLLTHPLVWIFVTQAGVQRYKEAVFESEVAAVLAEGIFLQALGVRSAFLWSLLANASSFGIGLLIHW